MILAVKYISMGLKNLFIKIVLGWLFFLILGTVINFLHSDAEDWLQIGGVLLLSFFSLTIFYFIGKLIFIVYNLAQNYF